jgi:plastocyanin
MSSLTNTCRYAFSLILIFVLIAGCSSTYSDNNGGDSSTPSFSSGDIAPGGSFSYTFESEGEYEYYCELHSPNMQGQITVSSSASSAERDTVAMEGDSFQPGDLTVAPNTEVVWVNNAGHDHTVVSGNPSSGGDDGGY